MRQAGTLAGSDVLNCCNSTSTGLEELVLMPAAKEPRMKTFFRVTIATVSMLTGAMGQTRIAGLAIPRDPNATMNVIVRYRQGTAETKIAEMIGGAVRHNQDLALLRSHAITIKAGDLGALAARPEVEEVFPDNPVAATAFSGTIDYGRMAVLGLTSSTQAFPYDGTGVGVAVIDSGISHTADLTGTSGQNIIVYSQSFVPGDTPTDDKFGHGTHVAGIIAGNGKQSTGGNFDYSIRGIAPNVRLVNLRVLDDNGVGSDSTVIAAIQRAIQLKPTYNIRVINLSVGRPVSTNYASDQLCQAVEQAWNAGIVVVVAAGNGGRDNSQGTNGYGTITAPGNDPFVITVGAMNTVGTLSRADDKIASYSSKGPTLFDHIVKPDLVAPGNRIFSLEDVPGSFINAHPENEVPVYIYSTSSGAAAKAYYQMSGTSMAAPMVAGAAALMLQKDPTLGPDTVKARLMKTAQKLQAIHTSATDPVTGVTYISENDIFTVGAGYLDVVAALASSDVANAPAISPAAVPNRLGSLVLVNGTNVLWGTNVIWGTNVLWGTNVIWGTDVVWGTNVLWGTNVIWGTAAVMGSNVLWGMNVLWGTNVIWGTGSVTEEAASIALNGEQ